MPGSTPQEEFALQVSEINDARPAEKWMTTDAWDKATAALGVR
jgi:hypothetical protein